MVNARLNAKENALVDTMWRACQTKCSRKNVWENVRLRSQDAALDNSRVNTDTLQKFLGQLMDW